jgi:hypothetical protein
MTNAQALAETIALADAWMERELANAEILLLDLGSTLEEVDRAIGRDGYVRRMLQEDRDRQVAAVARWLGGCDATLH